MIIVDQHGENHEVGILRQDKKVILNDRIVIAAFPTEMRTRTVFALVDKALTEGQKLFEMPEE